MPKKTTKKSTTKKPVKTTKSTKAINKPTKVKPMNWDKAFAATVKEFIARIATEVTSLTKSMAQLKTKVKTATMQEKKAKDKTTILAKKLAGKNSPATARQLTKAQQDFTKAQAATLKAREEFAKAQDAVRATKAEQAKFKNFTKAMRSMEPSESATPTIVTKEKKAAKPKTDKVKKSTPKKTKNAEHKLDLFSAPAASHASDSDLFSEIAFEIEEDTNDMDNNTQKQA